MTLYGNNRLIGRRNGKTLCRLTDYTAAVILNDTTEGVVLLPSLLAITTGSPPSITATHELVVPKSIPITFPMIFLLKL